MPTLEELEKLIASSPDDPFPRYGRAMKLRSAGRLDEAIQAFVELLARFPGYVPGYQQEGLALEAAGRVEEAQAAYRSGIAVALRAGDRHAAEEMQAALEALG
jgi:tetratricopeptide (TPR) repeat protein